MQVGTWADPPVDMCVYQGDFFVLWMANRENTMSEPAA
jgi:hypothetical protein